ncbi:MAG TPA: DUF1444 family protein [Planctomycetota bacterium]|nr:DUF1444 family protein [Planctomycetota bacterium]
MLAWIGLGWLALAVATAAAFHVVRRRWRPVTTPPEVRAFLRRFEELVRRDHPEVTIRGMLPGRFTAVLEIEGQEVPVPLHQLFRHASTFPETMPQMVDTLLAEIASGGLSRVGDHPFADVAPHILPQVRTQQWLAERSGSFGDAALVSRAFAGDLRVCYVIDDPWSMVFVCRGHLRRWGVDEEALHQLAIQNLRRLAGDTLPVPGPQDEPVIVRTGDGYDAARVLLLDPERAAGLIVAVPERDTLWLGRGVPGGDQLATLMQLNREQSAASAYPVSPDLYRVEDGRLTAINAEQQSPPA